MNKLGDIFATMLVGLILFIVVALISTIVIGVLGGFDGGSNHNPTPAQVCFRHEKIARVSVNQYGDVVFVVCRDGYGTDKVK